MDMIERVARVIWESGFDRMPDPPWDKTSHLQKEFNRMLARAAIEAMRAPHQAAFCQDIEDVIWNRRIDAALDNGQSTNSEGE